MLSLLQIPPSHRRHLYPTTVPAPWPARVVQKKQTEEKEMPMANPIRASTSRPLPPFPYSYSPYREAPSFRPSPCSSHLPSCDGPHLNRYWTFQSFPFVAWRNQQAGVAALPPVLKTRYLLPRGRFRPCAHPPFQGCPSLLLPPSL